MGYVSCPTSPVQYHQPTSQHGYRQIHVETLEQSVHHALPIWSHMANENWCMIGYHSVSVLADAIAKGLPIDKDAALKAMISSSTIPYYEGTKEFMELGYVPLDRNGSAGSLTLEYAYDDWTIYNTALLAGNRSVADTYKKRASNYANVFDTSSDMPVPVIRMVNSKRTSVC